jgi:hypothetical protein
VRESAASAKRVWFMFGAKPAQSETPVRAAAKRRPPGRGRSGKKDAKLPTKKKPLETFRSSPKVQFYGSRGWKCRK